MTYAELIEQLRKLPFEEVRIDSPGLFESVVNVQNLDQLHRLLEAFFGAPLKPAGKKPSKEDKGWTAPLGGIWENQTLYVSEQKDSLHCAVLWPWSDGQCTTLKIAQYERKTS